MTGPAPGDAASERERLLGQLTAAAVAGVPGTDHAVLVLHERGRAAHLAPTSVRAGAFVAGQVATGDGPCLPGRDVTVADLVRDTRWPSVAAAASAHGIRALLALSLAPDDAGPGRLLLLADRPDAFNPDARTVADAVALQTPTRSWSTSRGGWSPTSPRRTATRPARV